MSIRGLWGKIRFAGGRWWGGVTGQLERGIPICVSIPMNNQPVEIVANFESTASATMPFTLIPTTSASFPIYPAISITIDLEC